MTKKISIACICVFLFFSQGWAALYYVYLSEKCPQEFNFQDFSQKSIERRLENGLDFPQDSDLPFCEEQISGIEGLVTSLRYQLRWLGAVTVEANPDEIEAVRKLDFVTKIEPFQEVTPVVTAATKLENDEDDQKYARLVKLIRDQMGFDSLAAWDLHGRGVRVAIFDVGFNDVDEHIAFAHLRDNGKIRKVRDFYGKDEKLYNHHYHGTAVLSCIAGKYQDQYIGEAYEAEFLLARTEHLIWEKIIEEDHWLAAMEWADREGADIISSSLGYNDKRYTYSQMDGNTTKVTKAANMAFQKGILVINSIGNEGDSKFRYLGAPSDGDSVLAIGASNPASAVPLGFSSEGPNARGVLKPEISAPGAVLVATKNDDYNILTGTSFSAPLVTGLAACLMEKYPEKNNREIRQLLMELGHRYPYADYYLGYGIPSAANLSIEEDSSSLDLSVTYAKDSVLIQFSEPAPQKSQVISGKPVLYYQFVAKETGALLRFFNVLVPAGTGGFKLSFPEEKRQKESLRIWYEGFLWEEE